MIDRWCEQAFWQSINVDTGGAEILSCATGLFLCVLPWMSSPSAWTADLRLLRIMFVILGVGTFVYHLIPHDENDINAFDWFPMVLTLALLCEMLMSKFMLTGWYEVAWHLLLLCWMLVLLAIMNMFDYAYLNASLVIPPALLFVCYTLYIKYLLVPWVLLGISMAMWLINHFLCSMWTPLAVLHSVYHVTIGVALWEIGCNV